MFRIDSHCEACGHDTGRVLFRTRAEAQVIVDMNMSHGKNSTGGPWDYTFTIVPVVTEVITRPTKVIEYYCNVKRRNFTAIV